MRTIPANMLLAFNDQQGLNLKFIVEVVWAEGDDPIMYSTCEFADLEVYAYVKEFGDFKSVSHVEGLGAVSSMSIVFYDQFGHFKEKFNNLETVDQATATVYLTLDGIELFDLFEGKINDGIMWSNNELAIEVISENIEKEVGYQPSIDDVDQDLEPNFDALERRLNTSSAWPALFGTVKNYEIPIVWTQRVATIEEEVPYDSSEDPAYYQMIVDDHVDFTLDTTYNVNIVGRMNTMFSILGEGQFKTVTIPATEDEPEIVDAKVFRLTKSSITSDWYKDIPFTILPDVGIVGETDQPVTQIEITPGEFVIDGDTLTTLGPDGLATETVWLQFMKLDIRYTYEAVSGGVVVVTTSRYLNCVKQEGNICTLNEKLTLPSGAYDIYIRKASKSNDFLRSIPSGSKIYILGDRVAYVVDTKIDTTINRIAIKNGEELVTIDPVTYEVKTDPLWVGTHPPVLYIYMLAEIYMRYVEHYDEEGSVSEGLLASATSPYDTEAEAIAKITDIPCTDPEPNNVNFVYLSVEDAEDVVPEIAWQANKAVRYTRENNDDLLELIDLTDTTSPAVFTFTEQNVLHGSIEYGVTNKDDLYTVFKAEFQTNDMLKDLETIRLKSNVDKYESRVYDTDYYIFKSKTIATQKFSWWKDKLSSFHFVIRLTGFMDAFGLEVWDRVYVSLDPSTFYDPALGTPFVNTHEADPQPIIGYGRIKEISPDLKTGLIDFTIEVE